MKITTTVLLYLFAMQNVYAEFVDYGSYLTDTNSKLDWLDLTATVNRSYNETSSEFGQGDEFDGWRYASSGEFNRLISNWTNIAPYHDNEWHHFSEGKIDGLINVLGATFTNSNGSFVWTEGMIADEVIVDIGPNGHPTAIIRHGSPFDDSDFTAAVWKGAMHPDMHAPEVGSFLVRSSVVPLPAAVYLFGFGFISLLGSSRYMKKR